MKKRILSAALLLAMLLSLAACSKGEQTQPEAVETPEANFPMAFCLGAQPTSLDPKQYAIGDEVTYLADHGGSQRRPACAAAD